MSRRTKTGVLTRSTEYIIVYASSKESKNDIKSFKRSNRSNAKSFKNKRGLNCKNSDGGSMCYQLPLALCQHKREWRLELSTYVEFLGLLEQEQITRRACVKRKLHMARRRLMCKSSCIARRVWRRWVCRIVDLGTGSLCSLSFNAYGFYQQFK